MSKRKKPSRVAQVSPSDTPDAKVGAALIAALETMPLCAPAIRGLHIVLTDQVNTMMVDKHFRCYISPKFVELIEEEARNISSSHPCPRCGAIKHHPISMVAGVLCHEAWHLLGSHHIRAINQEVLTRYQGQVWNIAADTEINDNLLQIFSIADVTHKLCLPEDGITASSNNLETGKLVEEYYHILLEKLEEEQNKAGRSGGDGDGESTDSIGKADCGSGADGQEREWDLGDPGPDNPHPGLSDVEVRMIRKNVAKKIREAAKGRGNVPGGWKLWAEEELGAPKYNWRAAMRRMVTYAINVVPGDSISTYRRIGRRSASLGYKVILPSHYDTTPLVAVVQDTSGSMDREAMKISLEEINGVLKAVNARVAFINCDMKADKAQYISKAREIDLYGGGGTDMRIGIKAAIETRPSPDVIILFTDGFTPWPSQRMPKGKQLIVCLVGTHACNVVEVPSWARVIRVTDDSVEN